MGIHAHLAQPRRTPAFQTLVDLAPEGTDVVKVRAAITLPKRPGVWGQAELLAAYTWPRHEGEDLVPLDGAFPDDSNHASLTIGEFLATHEHAARLLTANDTAYTYLITLTRPRWEH